MSYKFYLDKILLPVSPSKLSIKISNKNKTLTLINDGEINILKTAGLSEISFEILLPNVKYSFAKYTTFKKAEYYLDKLETLKRDNAPFQFIVIRKTPDGTKLFNTNIRVSLEDYTIDEEAESGFDVKVSIKLKQYRDYATKIVTISTDTSASTTTTTTTTTTVTEPQEAVSVESPPSESLPDNTYTVQDGDCLWNICKYYFGDGSLYSQVAELNEISNPDLIYPGQVLDLNIS
jgi:LysM repeat protein